MMARTLSPAFLRFAAAVGLTWVATAPAGRAATIVYNSIVTIQGAQINGGATSATGNTAILADDITFLAGYTGAPVTAFTLNVNNSGASETATLTAEFFATDGANGGPGTLLGTYATGATTFGANQTLLPITAASLFAIPANGKIWAGFYFTGAAGGTLANLNSLGAYTESGGTIGSSTTNLFIGTTPAMAGANPGGSIVANPGGQGGVLGMTFAVPEPSSVALMILGSAGLVAWAVRRRKQAAQGA